MYASPRDVLALVEGANAEVLVHGNADLDAVASALLACRSITGSARSCCVYAKEGLSRRARDLLSALVIELPLCDGLDNKDVLITVDASNVSQLGLSEEELKGHKTIVIDHHEPGSLHRLASALVADKESPSCVELLVPLLSKGSIRPSEATFALAALLEETSFLERARLSTFKSIVTLIEMGGDYGLAVKLIRGNGAEEPIDRRVAKLKGLSRSQVSITCNGKLVVAVSSVGSFEADVARTLVSVGADVALVVNESRVSIRLSRRSLEAGLSASGLASYIAERLGGEGGGHEGAAVARLSSPAQPGKLLGLALNYVSGACGGHQ
ncbi:MAG: DHH family phosphoesterase [Acidilobus sp.]